MRLADTIKRHRAAMIAALLLAVLAGWIFHAHGHQFSREAILAYGKRLSPIWFVTAFMVLPLLGVPISIFLVLAGVRFGLWGGMVLTTCGVFFHNFIAYHLVHRWFREHFCRGLQRFGYRMPVVKGDNQAWFTALFTAIHGPPYVFKLYLLALTEIPFRIYFWVGAPVYIIFCLVPVGAGSAVMAVDTILLYGIVFGITILALVGKWLEKRFKSEL